MNTMEKLEDIPDQLKEEIEHFFSVYKDLEQKKVTVDGWYTREDAVKEIKASRERFRDSDMAEEKEPQQETAPESEQKDSETSENPRESDD